MRARLARQRGLAAVELALLLPFLVATLGVFVLRWTGYTGATSDLLQLPMPEWYRFVSFPWAQPVGLSAAIPMVFALISGPVKLLRRFAAGLAVGFSAYLVTAAIPVWLAAAARRAGGGNAAR